MPQGKTSNLMIGKATWHRMLSDKQAPPPAIRIWGRRHYSPEVISEWLRSLEQP